MYQIKIKIRTERKNNHLVTLITFSQEYHQVVNIIKKNVPILYSDKCAVSPAEETQL